MGGTGEWERIERGLHAWFSQGIRELAKLARAQPSGRIGRVTLLDRRPKAGGVSGPPDLVAEVSWQTEPVTLAFLRPGQGTCQLEDIARIHQALESSEIPGTWSYDIRLFAAAKQAQGRCRRHLPGGGEGFTLEPHAGVTRDMPVRDPSDPWVRLERDIAAWYIASLPPTAVGFGHWSEAGVESLKLGQCYLEFDGLYWPPDITMKIRGVLRTDDYVGRALATRFTHLLKQSQDPRARWELARACLV